MILSTCCYVKKNVGMSLTSFIDVIARQTVLLIATACAAFLRAFGQPCERSGLFQRRHPERVRAPEDHQSCRLEADLTPSVGRTSAHRRKPSRSIPSRNLSPK